MKLPRGARVSDLQNERQPLDVEKGVVRLSIRKTLVGWGKRLVHLEKQHSSITHGIEIDIRWS
jgi:hypothetical protein